MNFISINFILKNNSYTLNKLIVRKIKLFNVLKIY